MSKELVGSLKTLMTWYEKHYGIGFKDHNVIVNAKNAIDKFNAEGAMVFKLASAIQQFRNEPALLRCTKLRSTAGFKALVEAWNAYNAPVMELRSRISLLNSEITANEEENRTMQDEVDLLYAEIDAINEGK